MSRLTIIGTGYVGTSIGLALKQRKGSLEVVGHDLEHGRALEAKKLGAVDRAEWNLPAALERAGMVIVATPLHAMEKLFGQMAEFLEPRCIVTDTASLKRPTFDWAETAFGDRASYVGGHPIVTSIDESRTPSATLFVDRTYCVIASANASIEAVDQVTRLVRALGAKPMFIDPIEHDSHMAGLDQLPSIFASTLMKLAGASPSWRDGQQLAGPAFGAVTALAMEDPSALRAKFVANREILTRWLDMLRAELGEVQRLLDEDPEALWRVIETAHSLRSKWSPGTAARDDAPSIDLPGAREQFASWFLGGLGGRGRK